MNIYQIVLILKIKTNFEIIIKRNSTIVKIVYENRLYFFLNIVNLCILLHYRCVHYFCEYFQKKLQFFIM